MGATLGTEEVSISPTISVPFFHYFDRKPFLKFGCFAIIQKIIPLTDFQEFDWKWIHCPNHGSKKHCFLFLL